MGPAGPFPRAPQHNRSPLALSPRQRRQSSLPSSPGPGAAHPASAFKTGFTAGSPPLSPVTRDPFTPTAQAEQHDGLPRNLQRSQSLRLEPSCTCESSAVSQTTGRHNVSQDAQRWGRSGKHLHRAGAVSGLVCSCTRNHCFAPLQAGWCAITMEMRLLSFTLDDDTKVTGRAGFSPPPSPGPVKTGYARLHLRHENRKL
ncbi:hypothetical protein AAFF_G00137090 [Aldrovandia affinis]|uniref:Uncharacterized protein n=1 Tax=Aldrovandia affinis TaxID=143900 RepID=A0AAD7TBT0_9TELE|nr:hypothetical protein AAFF_G00137090 [Aldrovandia affinis]